MKMIHQYHQQDTEEREGMALNVDLVEKYYILKRSFSKTF